MCARVRAPPIDYNFSTPALECPWIDDFSTMHLSTRRDSIGDLLTFCRIRPRRIVSFTLRARKNNSE